MPAPRAYFDHNASTPLDPAVAEEMARVQGSVFANPSSVHLEGRRARDVLEGARERVSAVLGCRPREVLFTSGGGEAANLAVVGAARARRAAIPPGGPKPGVVTTAVEHACVLDAVAALAAEGFETERVSAESDGRVDAGRFSGACDERTVVASVMLANHETGAVMPVVDIASQLKGRGIAVHCDAAMGPAMLDVRVGSLGVDLLSLSAHKFNGPKGIGALYVRRGVRLAPLLFGGVQEGRARPGTENVVGAVGLARALELAAERRHDRSDSARGLADRLREGLSGIEGVSRVGPERERLPNTVLAEFEGCEGEALIVNLDLLGFSASTGSACAVGGTDPSPVLLAMGFSRKRAASTIRFSFGAGNTLDEVDRLVAALPAVVERLRAMAR